VIKAIIVDYGGVLVDTPSEAEHLARFAAMLGMTAQDVRRGVYGEKQSLWDQAKIGLLSEADYWVEVRQALALPDDKMRWLQDQFFEPYNVHHAFVDYLWSLRGAYQLALLSNAIPSFTVGWEKLGFLELFNPVINSSLVKVAKPDPDIFKLTTDRLKLNPDDCIVVDDQAKNTVGAARLGFHVVQYVDSARAIDDIKKLLG
jgi:putative hydrolase of the HAD superfamily